MSSIFFLLIALLSHVIPKRPKRAAFLSLHGRGQYEGNLKPLFETLARDQPDVECLWICRDRRTADAIRSAGYKVARVPFFWALPMLRAQWVFVDGLRSPLGLGRFELFQAWHGTGFKRIGTENPNRSKLGNYLVKRLGRMTALALATSEEDARRKHASLHPRAVVVTGAPRLDQLLSKQQNDTSPGINQAPKTILYAPTFRDSKLAPDLMRRTEWIMLDKLLSQQSTRMLVKRHPQDKTNWVPGNLESITDVTETTPDLNALISSSDIVVSDYSGIVTDIALLHKPIIWYIPDVQHYLQFCRSFHYDFPAILPGPVAYSFNELCTLLEDTEWFHERDYQARYQQFRERFHSFSDAKATQRALEAFRQHMLHR